MADQEFVIGEPAILTAKHQRRAQTLRPARLNPGCDFLRRLQGDLAVIDPPATGHHLLTISDGLEQRGKNGGVLENGITVDGHAHGFGISWITPGCHEPEILNVVIGTQSSHAADVERSCWLDQHHGQCQDSVLR